MRPSPPATEICLAIGLRKSESSATASADVLGDTFPGDTPGGIVGLRVQYPLGYLEEEKMVSSAVRPPGPDATHTGTHGGVLGRFGALMAGHARIVFGVWLLVSVVLGAAAPSVFTALAGAGWQADGSESVQVRELAQEHFGGNSSAAVQVVVHSEDRPVESPPVQAALGEITAVFAGDDRFGAVVPPQAGRSISPDGHTGILLAGANASTDEMVRAVDEHKDALTALSGDGVQVYPTGASALWSDFNEANHTAMIKAEMFSWPVTLAIMVLAFGSLVAAGLPLLLTMVGLVASAGGLVLLNEVTPISVWAMNFAMMFALALGIDYALFLVARFRDALRGATDARAAVAETMDTAGKAVLLSGLTVLVSLSAVLIVPAPAVRTMAVGIMFAVVFVLAATMTLLPAALGALGGRVNAGALPYAARQQHRSPRFAAWGRILHALGVILVLGFALLLVTLRAPLIAALGTLVSLLSTAAAFGVAKLIFQDGHGAGLLGFSPQGFLDGWGPVFFFAMIFAIAMDYTVFLLATAKEQYERSGDPATAQIDGLANSGRVIFAAAAVMVAVFFTFALAEPLPPKEMGIILGVAVLLDAVLVRLVLLPALLRLTGHAAWWSPAWLRRALPAISFAHR